MSPGARYLLLGKQGAGKGTQAVRLASHFGIPHIATGDILRAAKTSGTEFGRKASAYMERGELVPDEVVIGVVAERLAEDETVQRGFVLDGFPRTRGQAEELERMLEPDGLSAAIDIAVPTEVVLHRLSGRRVCQTCGAPYHVDVPPRVNWTCDRDGGPVVQREDDTEAAIGRRLELYERETGPLIDFYDDLGLLLRVDGVGTVDDVFERLINVIEEGRPPFLPAPKTLGMRAP